MQIIHHMTMDMSRHLPLAPVDAVQGDGNTRKIILTLLEDGKNWNVPEGVTAAVAFQKADGKKGLYDTLPDGTKAVTVTGNTVTAILAPQALTCPGEVSAAVVFHDSTLNQLATFPFTIRVKGNPAAGKTVSNDYYRYATMEEVSEAVEAALASLEAEKQEFLTKAEEALRVVHDKAAPAIVCEATGKIITATDASDRVLQGLSIYGKTVQNGTPTPSAPVPLESVGESGAVKTTVCGKNLLAMPFDKCGYSQSGAQGLQNVIATKGFYLKAGTYVVSGEINAAWILFINGMVDATHTGSYQKYYYGRVFTIPEDGLYNLQFNHNGGNITDAELQAVNATAQLEFGSVATNYEPYKKIQTLTASTPNGLPGIPLGATIPSIIKNSPVHMAGVWWNEEEQQYYISDTKDYAQGVYVQRVARGEVSIFSIAILEATSAVCGVFSNADKVYANNAGSICEGLAFTTNRINPPEHCYYENRGNFIVVGTPEDTKETLCEKYNGLAYYYVLAAPVETALPAEELAQYAALHTIKPNTTVFNDAGAGMALAYIADTKSYIDKKLAAISAAMLNA